MTVKLSINFGKIAIYYPNMLPTFILLFIIRMRKTLYSLFLIVFLHFLFISSSIAQISRVDNNIIPLLGIWHFELDPLDLGLQQNGVMPKQLFSGIILLPGSTDQACYGYRNNGISSLRLTRLFSYKGGAWYQKEIFIPENWKKGLKGRINAQPYHTDFNYSDIIANYNNPVISHEVGGWYVYPDFSQITQYYSNWQWQDLVHLSHPSLMNNFPAEFLPIVQMIPDWNRNNKIGLIFEAKAGKGKLLMTSIDLVHDMKKRPVARQMLYSLEKYISSHAFNPKTRVPVPVIDQLFKNRL